MNIVLNYDPVAAADPSFVADAQKAVAILNATFTNNISLTFNIGLGSFAGGVPISPGESVAAVNPLASVFLTYSQLRDYLLRFGQPNFFTTTNLPAGNSINGISNFWVSSSVAAAFGLVAPNRPPDGFVGIGTNFRSEERRVGKECRSRTCGDS